MTETFQGEKRLEAAGGWEYIILHSSQLYSKQQKKNINT